LKIIDRTIKIKVKIEVSVLDAEGKQYFLKEKYVLLYVISLILLSFAGIISILLMGIPLLFNVSEKWIIIVITICCLIPLLIFGIIPKKEKYVIKK